MSDDTSVPMPAKIYLTKLLQAIKGITTTMSVLRILLYSLALPITDAPLSRKQSMIYAGRIVLGGPRQRPTMTIFNNVITMLDVNTY